MIVLAVDTEYSFGNPVWTQLGGYSFSLAPGTATYRPWTDSSREALQLLINSCDLLIMHNQIADSIVLMQNGIHIPFTKLHDTLVMAYVLRKPELGLKPLANSELGMVMTTMEELTGIGKNKLDPLDIPMKELYPYACADADATRRLFFVLMGQLEAIPELLWVYENIERPTFEVNCAMQIHGVNVDWYYLADLQQELEATIIGLKQTMRSIVGRPLSWGHSPSVQAYIYNELGYPVQLSREGRPTLESKKAIPALIAIDNHPFLTTYRDYKEIVKNKGSYCDKLPKMAYKGRLHPSFKQFGTASGRYSSADPNLQNIPIRTEVGKRVRAAFIPDSGHVWLGVDYSQIELVMLAAITKDPVLVEIFQGHNPEIKDVHAYVTQIGGVPRRVAKELTYGKMNGQSMYGAYENVVKSYTVEGEKPPTWDEFVPMFRKHEQVLTVLPKHIKSVQYKIATQGYISTYFGRRMYGDKIKGEEFRSLLCLPHQGTAADIMKLALPEVYRLCQQYGANLICTVHDEVGISCPPEMVDLLGPLIQAEMENVWEFIVPIKTELKVGNNWEEAH